MAFWNLFQKWADVIEDWEYSPEMKKIVAEIDKGIPVVIKKAILAYIKTQYDKSEEIAMESLKRVKDRLNEII